MPNFQSWQTVVVKLVLRISGCVRFPSSFIKSLSVYKSIYLVLCVQLGQPAAEQKGLYIDYFKTPGSTT